MLTLTSIVGTAGVSTYTLPTIVTFVLMAFRFLEGARDEYLFSEASNLDLGTTQPPTQRKPECFSLG